jgi:hypothetical protein
MIKYNYNIRIIGGSHLEYEIIIEEIRELKYKDLNNNDKIKRKKQKFPPWSFYNILNISEDKYKHKIKQKGFVSRGPMDTMEFIDKKDAIKVKKLLESLLLMNKIEE